MSTPGAGSDCAVSRRCAADSPTTPRTGRPDDGGVFSFGTAPFWGSIPELIEVIDLAQSGKIKMLVEHFPLDDAAHAYHLLHEGKIHGRAVITPND